MASDSKGSALFHGDEVIIRCKVIDVQNGHVLTTTVEQPQREHWFESKVVELSKQGPHSKAVEAQANAPAPVAAAAKTADEVLIDAGVAKAKELRAKSLAPAA